MKILSVVGTRPEIIRLSRVLSRLDKYSKHTLVHTGQNYDYELNEIFFNDLQIKEPKYFLNAAEKTPIQTIGKTLIEIDKVLDKEKPDAMLVLGDTNSCISALAAKRKKIPVFHMEAGNRCFDQRVPEEINRKIVDHISDINLTYSSIAREYLLAEGLAPDRVIKTGSPMKEVLTFYSDKINDSNVLSKLKLEKDKFFLMSCHREENIDSTRNFLSLVDLIQKLDKKFKVPVVISTHPRTMKKFRKQKIKFSSNVKLLKPLSFSDYNKLQISAKVVLSDSGTISEESSILNFPAINIREAHERPEAMEEGAVMMLGLKSDLIIDALKILNEQKNNKERVINIPSDYDIDNVSEKVVRIIFSYADYVQRNVWKNFNN